MCDGIFCAMHRYMEAHKCPKIQTKAQEEKEYLKSSLVKVEFSKMESLEKKTLYTAKTFSRNNKNKTI